MKWNNKIIFLALILKLSSINVHATNSETHTWTSSQYTIIQLSDQKIEINNGTPKGFIIIFDLPIENVYLNTDIPIALITTYDKFEIENSKAENGAVMPQQYWTCRSFIVDLKKGNKYEYGDSCSIAATNIWSPDGKYALIGFGAKIIESNRLLEYLKGNDVPQIQISGFDHDCGGVIDSESWHWVSNNVVAFSGGACGTFLDYLFYVNSQKTEVFCSEYQQSRYGCPEHAFQSASELKKRLHELRK